MTFHPIMHTVFVEDLCICENTTACIPRRLAA
jgi:hypothetical protein